MSDEKMRTSSSVCEAEGYINYNVPTRYPITLEQARNRAIKSIQRAKQVNCEEDNNVQHEGKKR